MSRDKKCKGRQAEEEQDEQHSFIWHTEEGHRGKIIERILENSQSVLAKAHQKWLDAQSKHKARNAFRRSKKDSELN